MPKALKETANAVLPILGFGAEGIQKFLQGNLPNAEMLLYRIQCPGGGELFCRVYSQCQRYWHRSTVLLKVEQGQRVSIIDLSICQSSHRQTPSRKARVFSKPSVRLRIPLYQFLRPPCSATHPVLARLEDGDRPHVDKLHLWRSTTGVFDRVLRIAQEGFDSARFCLSHLKNNSICQRRRSPISRRNDGRGGHAVKLLLRNTKWLLPALSISVKLTASLLQKPG